MNEKERLDSLVKELAGDVRELVAEIEASPPVTQHHYGRYLSVILGVGSDASVRKVIALALLEAGANKAGVGAALRIAIP
jgi:hypothetical protein